MLAPFEENSSSRTLYVGNLDPSVSEELLLALFNSIGPCKSCKILHEPTSDPYAFIEFVEHRDAANAIIAMNKRLVLEKEIKVNWATTSSNSGNKIDTSKHFHIFVGDLAPEVDQNALREAFSPFGEISEIKIAKFPDTQKPKGYCFISFTSQSDAEAAINGMNGRWLGNRRIRTNWATRKGPTSETSTNQKSRDTHNIHAGSESSGPRLDFHEVWNRTTDTNTTVYFGNCGEVNDQMVRDVFDRYGQIQEVRIFKEKGYAFVRFHMKESACHAICGLHGSEFRGHTVKCGWGREDSSNDRNNSSNYNNVLPSHQNYNNQSYDAYGQNSYRTSSNNQYMASNNNSGYNNYGSNYQHPPYPVAQPTPQYFNSQQQQQQWNNNNHGGQPSWDPYSQTGSGPAWNYNNNNNTNNYPANSNQYYGQQQSHMYSSNSGWAPSYR